MRRSSITCDSSVFIPAFRPTGAAHHECLIAAKQVGAIAAHVLLETYSVLTRLPSAERVPGDLVVTALDELNLKVLQLPPGEYLALLRSFADARYPGGAIYDAQIAATAKYHGLTLLTRDRRAVKTYELIGVEYEFIG